MSVQVPPGALLPWNGVVWRVVANGDHLELFPKEPTNGAMKRERAALKAEERAHRVQAGMHPTKAKRGGDAG